MMKIVEYSRIGALSVQESQSPFRQSRGFVSTVTTIGILLALAVSSALSQTPIPPNVDVGNRQTAEKPRLDRSSHELADEYAELLIGLREVVTNYERYLRDYDDDVVLKYRPQLEKLRQQLDTTPLTFDERQIADQLRMHTDQLRRTEFHIRDSKTIYPMRLYRLVQGLRREMLSIDDLLQDDVLPLFEKNSAYRKAIHAYVSVRIEEEQRRSPRSSAAEADEVKEALNLAFDAARLKVDAKRLEVLQKKIEAESKSLGVVVVPPVPPVKTIKPPDVPAPFVTWSKPGRSSGTGLSRELGDTIKVTGGFSPVKIHSRYGRVEVVGWKESVIAATWTIEASGATRKHERAFIDSAALQIRRLPSGFVVAPVFSQPSEKTAQFVQNELVVYVPTSCPVTIDNLFGEVEASSRKEGLEASTTYADRNLTDIGGEITAICSMGELAISACNGPLTLKNAYAPITVEDCDGTMKIENAYAQITVSDCTGKLSVVNTGMVDIQDHVGNLTIDNSYGEVEVSGLRGSLSIVNQYQPIIVRDIDGNVKLEGAYSLVDISNVKGDALAVNKYGTIKAEGLSGPLLLDNEGGSTLVSLDDLLKGTSRITGKYGSIVVSVPETANLLVMANSAGGSISTGLPMQVTTREDRSEGVLRLGRKTRDSLFVLSHGGSILINSDR